jgi:hypothetical protein
MTTRLTFTAWIVAALAVAIPAQSVDITLAHTDIDTLPDGAKAAYEDAVDALDHQDTVGAVRSLARAAELAPDAGEIQIHFVTLVRETVRPDSFGPDGAIEISHKAIDSYERILSDEGIPDFAKGIAQRELGELMSLLDNIDTIYAERRQAGTAWIQSYGELQERWRAQREREEQALRERRRQAPDGSVTGSGLFEEAREVRDRGFSTEGVGAVSRDAGSTTDGVEKVD